MWSSRCIHSTIIMRLRRIAVVDSFSVICGWLLFIVVVHAIRLSVMMPCLSMCAKRTIDKARAGIKCVHQGEEGHSRDLVEALPAQNKAVVERTANEVEHEQHYDADSLIRSKACWK